MKKGSKQYLIGCSGYYYPQWKNNFYPEGLSAPKWLEHYSTVFNTVELNSPFYRVPKLSDLKRQFSVTPDGFKFSVKMNRYITHILRLKNTSEHIKEFTGLMEEGLSHKLHKLLFQMPPSFHYNEENLELINSMNWGTKSVIEFRHESWWNSKTEQILKKKNCSFCNVDFPGLHVNFMNTSKDFYLRLHGTPELFKSSYSEKKLKDFYQMIPKDCKTYAIYFNNTYYDAAYKNALALIRIINE